MPLFDFTCAACGKVSEILVQDSRENPACPHCAAQRLSRELPTFRAQSKESTHVHTGPGCGCGKPRGGCANN
jgi:putative FmdB family regulatory protein